MAIRSRQFWERLVREVEGGQTATAVARRYGVPTSSLSTWKQRLMREQAESAPALLPVVVRDERVLPGRTTQVLELRLGNMSLHFEAGTDPRYIAELVEKLRC